MKPYSTDLRERVVLSVESGDCNIPEAASQYAVSEPSIERWLARNRATDSCAPLPHAGGMPRKLAAAEAVIRAAVKEQPDATLQELCKRVKQKSKIKSGLSMMCRELARLKLPRKKKSIHASQRDTPRVKRKRTKFKKEVAALEVERLKFLDESGVNLSLTRLYGRAAPDQRVMDSTPQPSGSQTTTLAVIGLTGVTAPLVLEGAVNGTVFHGYIEQCVAPTLQPGDILFMDNLPAHKVAGIEALIEACGARLIYLPPYLPDFNPIELAWSKVKTILRRLKARTFPDLIKALKQALLAITLQDIEGWFAHCGYAIN
jgi:transposase